MGDTAGASRRFFHFPDLISSPPGWVPGRFSEEAPSSMGRELFVGPGKATGRPPANGSAKGWDMTQGTDLRQGHPLYREKPLPVELSPGSLHWGARLHKKGLPLPARAGEAAKTSGGGWATHAIPITAKPINNLFVSHLWRRKPRRSLPPGLEALTRDVDRFGTGIDTFMKQITVSAGSGGPCLYPGGRSQRDQPQDQGRGELGPGLRPYFIHLLPQQVLDWEFETKSPERFGQLNRAVLAEPWTGQE